MKYIIPFVVASLLLWESVGYAVEYDKAKPEEEIRHSWELSYEETVEAIELYLRTKHKIDLPEGERRVYATSGMHTNFSDYYIQFNIKEKISIIIIEEEVKK